MPTVVYLVRHAAHDNVGGFLAGRTPGVRLGEAGRAQAARAAERMAAHDFAAIYASPRERTMETAAAIAARTGLSVTALDDLDEVDFGTWGGRTFDDLNEDWDWRRWNAMRALARTPTGESMLDVQVRVLRTIERLAHEHAGTAIVLVTHADVIRAAVCGFLGLGLDAWSRIEIDPASLTTLLADDWNPRVLGLNQPLG